MNRNSNYGVRIYTGCVGATGGFLGVMTLIAISVFVVEQRPWSFWEIFETVAFGVFGYCCLFHAALTWSRARVGREAKSAEACSANPTRERAACDRSR